MFMSRCLALILSLTVSSSLSLQSKPYFQIIEEAVNLVQSGGKLNIEENFVDTVRYLKDFPRQILYGNEFGATKYNVSGNCSHSVQAVTSSAVAQPKSNTWALQILDAIGKPGPGILDGNLRWLGSYDECKRTEYRNGTLNIKGTYSIVYIPLGTTSSAGEFSGGGGTGILIGVCLPDSCSSSDTTALVHEGLEKIPFGNISNIVFVVIPEEEKPLTSNAIVTIVILSILTAIIVLSTAYDIIIIHWLRKSRAELKESYIDPAIKNTDNEKYPLLNHDSKELRSVHIEDSTLEKLLLSFSAYSNGKKILSTHRTSETLTALNGIRFLSISWVVLGHSYAFVLGTVSNSGPFLKDMLDRWTFQAISNALVAVDSFFALSGLLLTYLTLKEMDKRRGKLNWFMFYFHRFWRLTPAYMLVLMTEATLSPYFSDGPIYPPKGFEKNYCEDSWWKNLLYVNNLVDMSDMCMGWSWYLSNDMQFFILSPLMLIPLYYKEFIGIAVCLVFLIGTTIAPGVISAHYGMPPAIISQTVQSQDILNVYMEKYYMKPWCRMGPYIIGILFGYLLFKTKGKVRIHKILNLMIWLVAAVLACLVLYGLHDAVNYNPLSDGVSALYNATNRTVWGACVCWVIFACATGNGGFVNTLLSWSPFGPLARLSYCVYLVHPVLMYVDYYSSRVPMYLTDFSGIYLFLGNLVLSNMVAFVASLAFEAPMMGLEKVLLRKERK
ncbi:nose resistant to fluoxetine protein 6-like [Ostrea edulis]|uniref:nose resistant to fluoxetine protein 6-like n=1 Tax=Ostrea edulis TaxID=37623 RepID=UPI0024AEAB19|nr:nose resistant to fluoxetine protein 6-like [Ostrea edulis]